MSFQYVGKMNTYKNRKTNGAHQDISTTTPWTIMQSTKQKAQNNSQKKKNTLEYSNHKYSSDSLL